MRDWCFSGIQQLETPRAHGEQKIKVLVRIVNSEPQRNFVEERGTSKVCFARDGKVIRNKESQRVDSDTEFIPTLQRW